MKRTEKTKRCRSIIMTTMMISTHSLTETAAVMKEVRGYLSPINKGLCIFYMLLNERKV